MLLCVCMCNTKIMVRVKIYYKVQSKLTVYYTLSVLMLYYLFDNIFFCNGLTTSEENQIFPYSHTCTETHPPQQYPPPPPTSIR